MANYVSKEQITILRNVMANENKKPRRVKQMTRLIRDLENSTAPNRTLDKRIRNAIYPSLPYVPKYTTNLDVLARWIPWTTSLVISGYPGDYTAGLDSCNGTYKVFLGATPTLAVAAALVNHFLEMSSGK